MNCDDYFYEFGLPPRPYVTNNHDNGLAVVDKERMHFYQHVQINLADHKNFLALDVDFPVYNKNTYEPIWEEKSLPQPTYAVISKEKGTGHLIYMLEKPVHTANHAQYKFYTDLVNYYTYIVKSDVDYVGMMAKNPFHPRWSVVKNERMFTLGELKEYVPDDLKSWKCRNEMKKERKASGEGRNSKLFNKVRTRYYDQMEKFESYDELIEDVTECVTHHNKEGLSVREAKGIAKSIAKYCWKNRIKMMEKRRKEVLTTEEIRCRQSMGGKQKSVVANDTLVKSIYYFIDNGITKIKQREFVNQSELSLRYVQTNWGMITHSLSTGDTSFLSLSSSTTCSDPYNVVKDSITSSLGSIQSLVCHSTPSNPDSPIPRASFMLH